MITDFLFLWQHREKPVTLKRWVVVWCKRALLLTKTVALLVRPVLLKTRGAKVGSLVVLGSARIQGKPSHLSIGDEVSLGQCTITLHDRVVIGSRVVINDGVNILTASHSLSDPHWQLKKGPVEIGDYAWVATNAIILPGVRIGRGSVIGAGAVVRSNVPDFTVAIGNPARVTKIQRTQNLTYSPVLLNAPFEAWIGKTQIELVPSGLRE